MQTDLTLEVRRATATPSSFDAVNNTVEAVVASAEPVKRRDSLGEFLEVLAVGGVDLASLRGLSVLNNHQQNGLDKVIGVVEDARVEGSRIIARIKFSSRADVAPYVADVKAGVIRFFSIGYSVETWADSKSSTGQRTRTATRWTPREISMVAVAADPTSTVRNSNMTTNTTTTDDVATRRRTVRDIIARSGGTTADADTLIDADADMNTVKSKALDLMLARGNVSITTTRHNANTLDNPDALIRAAGEALYCRVDPAHKPEEASRQFIGLTIPELARELLRRQGVNTTGMSSDTVITRAMMSTSDFPLILSDTVNRTLRVAYSAAPSGIRQLGRQTTANDFRMKSRLMLDSSGLTLLPVLETGEYKYAALAEAGESYRLNTFGRIIPISRQALVNDDLSAFSDLTRRLGQAAASFESQTLVDLLEANGGLGPTMSDGQPLFDATHGNMAATGAALSLTTDVPLSDARLSMRKQVSPSGGLIAVTPRYLLVPSELETTGEKLLATIHATDVEQVSVWSKLTLVVEPRFKNATRWYVVADPAEIDGLEICYLAGGQGPQTESRAGFHVDGVEVKIREDFGCGFVETRGWYTNDGTP